MTTQIPSISWVIGVSLALLADFIGNIGVQLLKIAHCKMIEHDIDKHLIEKYVRNTSIITSCSISAPFALSHHIDHKYSERLLSSHSPKAEDKTSINYGKKMTLSQLYICNPLWIMGTTLQFVGSFFDFIAVGFAPQSVIAPIGSLVVVINLLFTPLFQKEIPSKQIVYTTSIVVLGSMITTAFSPKNHNNYDTVKQVVDLYGSVYFICYAIVISIILFILILYHNYCKKYKAKYTKEYERKYFKSHRFVIGTLSGIMGAQNILFAKGVSTMIIFNISNQHNNESYCFTYWEWYLLFIIMSLTVYFQLKWLNYGLKYFSPMQIIPIFQSFWTLIGILGGLIVFQEFDDFQNIRSQCLFIIGCIIIISAILYLTNLDKIIKYKPNDQYNQHNINHIVSVGTSNNDNMTHNIQTGMGPNNSVKKITFLPNSFPESIAESIDE